MKEFPPWLKESVPQKHRETGCIPTGYQFLLRVAEIPGINHVSFQDEFDLDLSGGTPRNNFQSVAAAVTAKYPSIRFETKDFNEGEEKLSFIEKRLAKGEPVLVSLAVSANGGWHIMPVVALDETNISFLWARLPTGECEIFKLPRGEFIRRHNEWPGGKDVAFLNCPPAPHDAVRPTTAT